MGQAPRHPCASKDVTSFLSEVPGFDRLDDRALGRVADLAMPRSFEEGEHIMRRGEEGDCMHVIVEGEVLIPLVDERGRNKLTVNLGPRELIGEMALLTGAPRTADVTAEVPVHTLVLPRQAVLELLSRHPELARFLYDILGRRLGEQGGIQSVGKYHIAGTIGEGNNGKVYRALHPTLNRVVAVKMLSHDLVYQRGFRERFLDEARTLAGLSHENIVQIFDTEEAYGTLFIVMEAIEGASLEKLLKQRGKLEADEVARILHGVASALAYAHERGIAHRDVKPANVAVEPDGGIKLMDFGLARAIREDPGARTRTIDGTPQYLAPEIALGREGDGRVDVYALGVMAFEMLSGRPPFQADSVRDMLEAHVRTPPPDIRDLVPDVPVGLADFIEGALEKDPALRLFGWDRIKDALSRPPDLEGRSEHLEERVVRVRCRPEAAGEVDAAIAKLRVDLSSKNVSVAVARLLEGDEQ